MPKKNDHSRIDMAYQIIDDIYFYQERTGNHYFLGNVKDENGKQRPVRAHVYVWEKHNGKVPKGYSVHHIDENPANNDISNLKLLSYSEHSSLHSNKYSQESRKRMLDVVQPKAVEWHKSELSNDFHKEHYEKYAMKIWSEKITKICEVCGKEYETIHAKAESSRFCSGNCKSKHRRMSGIDNETRKCYICGSEFTCNKYSKQKTCGSKCSAISCSMTKTEAHRQ